MSLFDRLKNRKKDDEEPSTDYALVKSKETNIIAVASGMLEVIENGNKNGHYYSIPIGELAAIGGAVGELVPSLRTVTNTVTISADGLYRLAEAKVGDKLKLAKDGLLWGAKKTAQGESKLAKFAEVGSLDATSKAVMAINPTTMMVAVALGVIEKQLGDILELERQILSFLEREKEATIESQIRSLVSNIQEYKYNWDNPQYLQAQQTHAEQYIDKALQNMSSIQKEIADILKSKNLIIANAAIDADKQKLLKKIQYYRMALYTYSLAELWKVMLLHNYQEEYLQKINNDILTYEKQYKKVYADSLEYLSKKVDGSIETNVAKGIGIAGKAIGNLIGNIPVIKDGPVDEWLIKGGNNLEKNSQDLKDKKLSEIELLCDSGADIVMKELDNLKQIFNHTTDICFDRDAIYLLQE